ncbi:MAG: DUF1929 domain-containing protein [Burkholderiaceae bacterium]|nr:DUF1929 domain-containing protein [Burkholderiaceae bacterium]
MTYGTDLSRTGTGAFMYDVFDPAGDIHSPDSHLTLENRTGTYLFCSSQVVLPLSGELLLNGGDIVQGGRPLSRGNDDTNIFNPSNNQLRSSTPMKRPRWYSTTTVLPNGELYIQGGTDGEDHPELRDLNGQSILLEGIDTLKTQPGNGHPYFDNNYPRNFVAPDGTIFGFDHHWMYRVEPYQTGEGGLPGRLTILGTHWDVPYGRGWVASSTAVMYRPGKILQVGGTSNNATLIDITGPTPRLKDLPRLSQVRQWANATVLADGRVLVSGGSTKNLLDDPAGLDAGQIGYHTEIFDPVTETWSIGASMTSKRLYHSVTLLLPDGSVLSSGGGSPGPVDNLDAQVYYPGYLFASDGTRAARPVIEKTPGAVPRVVNPGGVLQVVSPDAAAIRRVTLVKTGSVTHSFDMEQRFVEATFSRSGNTLNVQLPPAAQHATPPGFYMVFVIDAAGTPSEALMIRVNPT